MFEGVLGHWLCIVGAVGFIRPQLPAILLPDIASYLIDLWPWLADCVVFGVLGDCVLNMCRHIYM